MKRLTAMLAAALFVLALSVPAFASSHMKGEGAAKEPAVKTDNTVEKKEGKEMKKEGVKPKKQKKEAAGC